ncbi:hypothetical protein [Mucilaginibacter sp.]
MIDITEIGRSLDGSVEPWFQILISLDSSGRITEVNDIFVD